MNVQHCPPLNALRAFEAAARHGSVKLAAEELCVTPGAVSQLLKTLEAYLGVQLFERASRGICLTEAGRSYHPAIRNAFRQIGEATRRVAVQADDGMLTVSATPFFASAWLIPRMQSFRDAHPDIDLQIVASSTPADFQRGGVDVAVRHGMGHYPGLRSDRVVTVAMIAVAAPQLVEQRGWPGGAADLAAWPLVHDAQRKGWALWFQTQGVAGPAAPRGRAFDDTGLLLRAVLSGQGVGWLPAAMVAAELDAGQLIRLAQATQMEAFAYYLVCPEENANRPRIAAFRQWMLDAAA